ncbi:hypothetical protein D9756_006069 [Leucocoprinus leucothites]|uniref:Uncharacterized protein n=1 Tax=Leucocoprinus leucothites TaxID=201217 RepID=A0A8H5D318_9AGAR|nr:hypothetical protein D9756_006069 [Leucoagaricus leucothites]
MFVAESQIPFRVIWKTSLLPQPICDTMSDKSQYAAAAKVPLIKSPSLRVPKPVELPQDIHPLPESVTPYALPITYLIPQFVYPFTLEPHIITLESSRRSTIAAHAARREAYIRSRVEEIERRRRDALHKIAPGLGTMLVPTRASSGQENAGVATSPDQHAGKGKEHDVMDDLVNQLAALESNTAGGSSS